MFDFRPPVVERPLRVGDEQRSIVHVVAIDPPGLVCEQALLANCAMTLGIPLVRYAEERFVDSGDPQPRTRLVWTLEAEAVPEAQPRYRFSELFKLWNDPAWLAANPGHEIAIIRCASYNLLRWVDRARRQPRLDVYQRGSQTVIVPREAGEAERQKWLDQIS